MQRETSVGEGRCRRKFSKRLQSAVRRENLAGEPIETTQKAEASGANQGNWVDNVNMRNLANQDAPCLPIAGVITGAAPRRVITPGVVWHSLFCVQNKKYLALQLLRLVPAILHRNTAPTHTHTHTQTHTHNFWLLSDAPHAKSNGARTSLNCSPPALPAHQLQCNNARQFQQVRTVCTSVCPIYDVLVKKSLVQTASRKVLCYSDRNQMPLL